MHAKKLDKLATGILYVLSIIVAILASLISIS